MATLTEPETPSSDAAKLQRIVDLLGGPRVLRHRLNSPLDAHEMLLAGLPGQALQHLIDNLSVLRRTASLEKAVGMSSAYIPASQGRAGEEAEPGAERAHLAVRRDSGQGDFDLRIAGSGRAVAGTTRHGPGSAASDRSVGNASRRAACRGVPRASRVRRLRVTPLPPPLGGRELVAWRLDQAAFAAQWDSGEGAYRAGGRWNSRGVRAVYCSIDPATAILEVAVQRGSERWMLCRTS